MATFILFAAITIWIIGLTCVCIGVWEGITAIYRYWTRGDK